MQHALPKDAAIDPRQPRSSQIYSLLRSAIIDLALPPTAPIKKEEIAAQLGVSRTPISDAINRLAEEGLVEIYPQHGTYVAKIRVADVIEGAFLRRALEVATVREVARNMLPEIREELERNLRYQRANLDAGDLEAFYRLDIEFHRLLSDCLGFPRIGRTIDSSRAQFDRARKMLLPVAKRSENTYREHRRILQALCKASPDDAAKAMKSHLDTGLKQIKKFIKEHPELFD